MANEISRDYYIGVSSGHHRPPQTMFFSLTQKLTNITTWGVNYTQVDIQDLSEVSKGDVINAFKHAVDSLGLKYGMHAEIDNSVGFDFSFKEIWESAHIKLNQYMDILYDFYTEDGKLIDERYIPDYIDFHISYGIPIRMKAPPSEIQDLTTVTPWGESNWAKFLEDNENKILFKWFLIAAVKSLLVKTMRATRDPYGSFKQIWLLKKLKDKVNDFQVNMKQIEKITDNSLTETIQNIDETLNHIRSDPNVTPSEKQNLEIFLRELKKQKIIYETLLEKLEKGKIYDEFENESNPDNYSSTKIDFELNGTRQSVDIPLKDLIDFEDIEENNGKKRDKEECKGLLTMLYRMWTYEKEEESEQGVIKGENYSYAIMAKYLEYVHRGKIKKYKINSSYEKTDKYKILWDYFINRQARVDSKINEDFKKTRDYELKNILEDMAKENPQEFGNDTPRLIEFDGTVHMNEDLVAMVATFYTIIHFSTPISSTSLVRRYNEDMKRKGYRYLIEDTKIGGEELIKLSPIEKLRKLKKLNVVFENPHVMQHVPPAEQRIVKAVHMERFAKCCEEIFKNDEKNKSGNRLYLLLDFGWWQANGMVPEEEVRSTSKDFGKYVKSIQLHYAYGSLGNHYTIELGEKSHERMYQWLYLLQQRGMGTEINSNDTFKVPIVFERGGGQSPLDTVRTSVFAMRNIVKGLKENKELKDLDPSFYGVDTAGYFSPEKQLASIKEHAFDPIKGMLKIKEFEHTFTGANMLKEGKRPDEILKERYK